MSFARARRGARASMRAVRALRVAPALAWLIGPAIVLALPARAEEEAASAPAAARPFKREDIDAGHRQFERTCAPCHGRNMVNSGTTVYDLRRFPLEQSERFFSSVTNGKGNMPSFREALTPEQMRLLWAYVGSRGGKEP
jgi:mono/diheme cytochrome c family protein